jgi:hypothetical protein
MVFFFLVETSKSWSSFSCKVPKVVFLFLVVPSKPWSFSF